jgi:hypothetical protein
MDNLGLYIYAGEDLPDSAKSETLSNEQQATIRTMIQEVDGNLDRLLTYFKVKNLADILATDFDRVMRSLEKGRRAAA